MAGQPFSLSNLNPEQLRATKATGHLMVSACPGSGKTRLLSSRAATLLTENSEGLLLAVSFTRDSSEELKTRILAGVGDGYKKRFYTGTFHSVAMAQLVRQYGREHIRVLSDPEQDQMLCRAWGASNTRMDFEELKKIIDVTRAKFNPEPLQGDPAEIYGRYLSLMRHEKVHDFQELLLRSVREMQSGEIKPIPARWLLVDETQDMDEIQYAWISAHAKAGTEVTIVGDDDQSIYGWRSAMGFEGMNRFREEFNAGHITLSRNYRCSKDILSVSAKLIGHNTTRVDKPIRAERDDRGSVEVYRLAGRDEEALKIATEAVKDPVGTWAVLARSNWLLLNVQSKLSGLGAQYYIRGTKSIWKKRPVVAYLSLLRAINTDTWHGMANTLYIMGTDPKFLDDMKHISDCASIVLPFAAKEIKKHEQRLGKDRIKPILDLAKNFSDWQRLSKSEDSNLALIQPLNWFTGYLLKGEAALVQGVYDDILKNISGNVTTKLHKLIRIKSNETKGTGVGLLTIHAAKGLEFDNVWVMGMEAGIMPHSKAKLQEEERRLAYVAFTRARNRLCLSHTLGDKITVSPYLEDAGINPVTGYITVRG